MKKRIPGILRILIPGIFALLVRSSAALAERDFAVEVFGGYFTGETTRDGFVFGHDVTSGVRASHFLSPNRAVEISISRTRDFLSAFNYEISGKGYLLRGNRTGIFLIGGVGDQRIDAPDTNHNTTTVHAGIGGEINLTDRMYLRPQVLARWPSALLKERFRSMDYTVGFGWRY